MLLCPAQIPIRVTPARARMSGRMRLFAGLGAVVVGTATALLMVAGPAAATVGPDVITQFAGDGNYGSGAPTAGPATSASFAYAWHMAVDAAGNIYVADAYDNVVDKITPAGQLSVVAGTGTAQGSTPPPTGPATSTNLYDPQSVALDSAGNLYIASTGDNVVEKVDHLSGLMSVYAGSGAPVPSRVLPTPGPATSVNLRDPAALAIDSSDNLYISDDNYAVYKVDTSQNLTIVAGTGTSSSGAPTPGPATSTALGYPYGLAVSASGDLYIADGHSHVIDRVDTGGQLSVFAGTGTALASGTLPVAGPATAANLRTPDGMAFDASGNLYVADAGAAAAYKIDTSGHLSVVAGTGSYGTRAFGSPAISSPLSYPQGVAIGTDGLLYISDYDYIEKIVHTSSPGAPTGLALTGGDTTASVSFTVPASSGGYPITSYQVSTDGGATWVTFTPSISSATATATLSGLSNGNTYPVQVRAVNTVGVGTASSTVSVTPAGPSTPAPNPTPTPALPATLAAPTAVAGPASATITWAASTTPSVTGYTVSAHPGPATCTTTSITATSCVIGAITGVATTYTVTAHSPTGDSPDSPASNPVTATTPEIPPAPPTTAPATLTTTDGTLSTVQPAQPVTVVGTGFAAYSTAKVVIYSDPIVLATITTDAHGDFTAPVTVPTTLSAGAHTFVASGTDPTGAIRQLQMPVTLTTATYQVPAPTTVKARTGTGKLTLTFTRPTTAAGTAITGYQVSLDDGKHWTTLATTGATRRSATITGLKAGATYTVRVRALTLTGTTKGTSTATAGLPVHLPRPWYHDPLTAGTRAKLVPVPTHPGNYHGKKKSTRALHRSHNGTLAVPASTTKGHHLIKGQAATLTGDGLFRFDSAVITRTGTTQLRTLATSLKTTQAITCEGYTDYAGNSAHEKALSTRRATAVCAALTSFGVHARTHAVGYGRARPVVIGGTPTSRAPNRRVVILITQ